MASTTTSTQASAASSLGMSRQHMAYFAILAVLLIAAGTSILSVRTVRERHDPAHWRSVVPTRFAT